MRRHARIVIVLILLLFSQAITQCGYLGGSNLGGKNTKIGGGDGGVDDKGPGPTDPLDPIDDGNGTLARHILEIFTASPVDANRCWPAVINAKASGKVTPVKSNTSLTLPPVTNVTYYSRSGCSPGFQQNTFTIFADTSSIPFWFKVSLPGTYELNVVAAGNSIDAGKLTVTVGAEPPIPPTQLSIAGPSQLTAGACAAYIASYKDANNNPASFPIATPIDLIKTGAGEFFDNPSCNGNPIVAPLTIGPNQTSKTFYFRSTAPGAVTFSPNANGIAGNHAVIVAAGPAMKLAVQGPTTELANLCAPYFVISKDSFNNVTNITQETQIALATTGNIAAYVDATCSTLAPTLMLVTQTSSKPFFAKGSNPGGAATITAESAGLDSFTHAVTVTSVPPGASATLSFTAPPSPTTAGNCFGPLRIGTKDSDGNTTSPPKGLILTLSQFGQGQFFSDSQCQNAFAPTPTVGPNTDFYFRNFTAENIILKGAGGGLADALLPLQVNAGAPYQLLQVTPTSNLEAGSCAVFSVKRTDAYGNAAPVQSLTQVLLNEVGLITGDFYSNSTCSSLLPIPANETAQAVLLNIGEYQKTFYFRETKAGSGSLTATETPLVQANQSFTVSPGPPVKALLTSSPPTVTIGQCGGPYTLKLYDQWDNVSPTAALRTFDLSLVPAAGALFADSQCQTGPLSQLSFKPGQSQNNFWYLGPNTPTTVTGGITTPTFPPVSFNVDVKAAGATRLVFVGLNPLPTTGPATGVVGNCYALRIDSRDANNQITPVPADLAVNLAHGGGPAANFYSNNNCLGVPVASTILPAAYSSVTVWFKDTRSETDLLSAQVAGLQIAQYQITLQPTVAETLTLSGQTSTLPGACSGPFTIGARDRFNNKTLFPNGLVINLSGAGGGHFYADYGQSCSNSLITSLIARNLQTSLTFNFKSTVAEDLTLSVSANDLLPATHTLKVLSLPATSIQFFGPIATVAGTCSGQAYFRTVDAYGNIAYSPVQRIFQLTQNGTVQILADDCLTPISTIVIGANQTNSGYFRFKAAIAQTGTITVALDPLPNPPFTGTRNISITTPPNVEPPVTVLKVKGPSNATPIDGPITVNYNETVRLSWNVADATCAVIDSVWAGSSNDVQTPPLTQTTRFTLACSNAGGTTFDSVDVNVTPPSAPVVELKVNGAKIQTINYNTGTTLTWTSTGIVSSCTLNPDFIPGLPANGSYNTGNLTQTVSYALTCTGPGGSDTDVVTVMVNPAPLPVSNIQVKYNGNISQGPLSVPKGTSTVELQWSCNGAVSGQVTNTIGGPVYNGLTGPVTLPAVNSAVSYTLRCTNATGQFTEDTVKLYVVPTPNFYGTYNGNRFDNSVVVPLGASVTLTWECLDSATGRITPGSKTGLSGTLPLTNLVASATYTLTCTNQMGQAQTKNLVINVDVPPVIGITFTINGSPTNITVPYGATVNAVWSSSNANSCTAAPYNWTGLTGSRTSPALWEPTVEFRITCTNSTTFQSNSKAIVVTVLDPIDHLFFTTRRIFAPNFGGVEGADQICQNAAVTGGKRPNAKWRAIVADATHNDASQRIPLFGDIRSSCSGNQVITTAGDFWSNRNWSSTVRKNCSETGGVVDIENNGSGQDLPRTPVWTGLNLDGTGTGVNCANWQSLFGSADAGDAKDNTADDRFLDSKTTCNCRVHLYCISGERLSVGPPPPLPSPPPPPMPSPVPPPVTIQWPRCPGTNRIIEYAGLTQMEQYCKSLGYRTVSSLMYYNNYPYGTISNGLTSYPCDCYITGISGNTLLWSTAGGGKCDARSCSPISSVVCIP